MYDAIQAAHGTTPDANTDAVNLARPLADGERVFVPRNGEPAPSEPAGTTAVVHINTASERELDALPGVGPATAAAIVAYRTAHGPFATIDELASVKGIAPNMHAIAASSSTKKSHPSAWAAATKAQVNALRKALAAADAELTEKQDLLLGEIEDYFRILHWHEHRSFRTRLTRNIITTRNR